MIDRFLAGGEAGAAAPEARRLFVGGSSVIAGNTAGFDNLRAVPVSNIAQHFESARRAGRPLCPRWLTRNSTLTRSMR